MIEKLLTPYNPLDAEDRIYAIWKESGFFNPDVCIEKGVTEKDAPYFSIVLPPPNVTGTLHLGSAYMLALQDIMTRFARMQAKRTLWIPGTDHAAIATQSKVEKQLQKEHGKSRHDFGREAFLHHVGTFAQESHDTIVSQMMKMGCSVDWSREAFTLDQKRNIAVKTTFKQMYDDGLIYRGYRVVNWDPKGQTTISDDEVVYEERQSVLYTFKYSPEFPIAISTTRPETKVGDTAVAVHPDDIRYKEYVGKTYDLEFCGESLSITVVADISVDPLFGTGALGVTPAHSSIDWEIAQRHNLPQKPVINEFAKMSVESPLLSGKKVLEARELVVAYLKEHDLLLKEEAVTQNVSTAERTGGIIEPLPKLQWFINVNKEFVYPHENLPHVKKGDIVTLKKLMLSVVEEKNIDILPDRFVKVYTHWIENLRDWCISRQIWYGHRIPVWYKGEEIYCGIEAPEGADWEQDSDTLDTWFSSGLWTFSTLGWPAPKGTLGETGPENDLANYHPTTILETGYDILFPWVARMILMSTYLVGAIPFKTVYLHGLVRDNKGQKISKSLGNNIDPLDMIKDYGADAVRMALIIGTGPGNDSKISLDKFKAYKHFANKIWNIARFVVTTAGPKPDVKPEITDQDYALLEEQNELVREITEEMDQYKYYLAGEKLYHYIWHRFADVIIEESKPILKDGTDVEKNSRVWTLYCILETSLTALHPFMPFITEELWSILGKKNLLMTEKWPLLR
ncbi:MAG: valine--tRNA ligase [Candidatus Zambryskibacteria bacterium]|nr:valine--tRNA ligase [Candidatus Zambryskibacteria bacterium]